MKRTALVIMMTLSLLSMMAQKETVRVDFQGAQPTIVDFLSAYLYTIPDANDLDECDVESVALYDGLRTAFLYQGEGIELHEGETLTIDQKNGYLLYELRRDEYLSRIQMCFWNESDGKHKLFACIRETFMNGRYVCGQFDNQEFYRYDNATKTMRSCSAEDIGIDAAYTMGGPLSFSLPRTGKDITVTQWNDKGKTREKQLKWNGHGFNF